MSEQTFLLIQVVVSTGFVLWAISAGYGWVIKPVLKIKEAKDWHETPCVITSLKLKTVTTRAGPSYDVEIQYTYEQHGMKYESSRYSFWDDVTFRNPWKHQRALADKYQPWMETVCYVNPKNLTEAVLMRGYSSKIWPGLLCPLIFLLLGLALLVHGVYKVLKFWF